MSEQVKPTENKIDNQFIFGSTDDIEKTLGTEPQQPATDNEPADDFVEGPLEGDVEDKTQPTDAPEEKKDVSFDDFEKEMFGVEPDKKEADKAVKPTVEPVAPSKEPVKVARDYSGLNEEETVLAKKMSNDSFAYFKKTLEDKKQLAEQLEQTKVAAPKQQSYYEHPDAYVLTDAFRTHQAAYSTAGRILQHWRDQLEKVEAGEDWQDLDMDTQGNLVLSEPKVVTAKSKAEIYSNMNFASGQLNQQREALQKVRDTHVAEVHRMTAQIKQVSETYMPMFKNPPERLKNLLTVVEGELEKIGLGMNNPAVQMLAKSAALNKVLFEYVAHLKQAVKPTVQHTANGSAKTTNSKVVRDPTTSDIEAPGKTTSVKKAPTIEDFERVMSGA